MGNVQNTLWDQMIQIIREYGQCRLDLRHLVDHLEWALDDAALRDEALVRSWYELWEPLKEIDEETSYGEVDHEKAGPLIEKMKNFLLGQRKLWVRSSASPAVRSGRAGNKGGISCKCKREKLMGGRLGGLDG